MAKVTNAFDTYSATANREELADVIYNIAPTDTPVMTAAGRKNVSNVTFDWQSDTLASASATGVLEGDALSQTATTATTRESNVCQINRRDATVTGTQEASNPAGAGNSQLAYSMSMRAKEIKRDMETAICGKQNKTAGDATTARATRGVESWISTNASRGTSGANSSGAVTDGTQRVFTEAMLKDVLQQCFDAGADPSVVVVGGFNKQKISGFTGRASARQMIDANTIEAGVDIFASDFGQLAIQPSRFSRGRSALCLDANFVSVAYLRDFETYELGKTGDASTQAILAEWGVCMHEEAAHGIVADLTTS